MAKGIIFDMDGVLFDTQPLHFQAERETITHFGYPITEEELKEYLGWRGEEFWADVIVRYSLDTTVEEMREFNLPIIERLLSENVREDLPLTETLSALKSEGFVLAVASSARKRWVDFMVKRMKIERYFDSVVCGTDVENGKPAPDIFLFAAERIGVEPEKCVVVEDAPSGIQAANSAKMYSIALKGNVNSGLDLSKAKRVISSLQELPEIIEYG